MKASLVVFMKEVRENLRDRRTVINTLLTGPLMAPLIFVILINTMITRELDKADQPLSLPIVGAENAPNLVAALKQNNVDVKPAPDDPERAVREQDADVVLRIPKDFEKTWNKGDPTQLEVVFDQSQRDARSSVDRLRGLLEAYSQRGGAMRLLARGLSPSIIKPLTDRRSRSIDAAKPLQHAVRDAAVLLHPRLLRRRHGARHRHHRRRTRTSIARTVARQSRAALADRDRQTRARQPRSRSRR